MIEAFRAELTIMIFRMTTIFPVLLIVICGLSCGPNEQVEARKIDPTQRQKVNNVSVETEKQPEFAATDIKFASKISRADGRIDVEYTVTNSSAKDIYLLDSYPSVDPETRTASSESRSFYLCFREPSTAFVLRGIPPLPSMPVNVRVMPLATKLEPGKTIEREFGIPLPLRERSDWYYAPLAPEEYIDGSIDHISLGVQFLRSTVEGFAAEPAHYAPELFIVNSRNIVGQAETLKGDFQIEKTQLFIRKDLFPRK